VCSANKRYECSVCRGVPVPLTPCTSYHQHLLRVGSAACLRDQQPLVFSCRGLRPSLEPDQGTAGEAVGRVSLVRHHWAADVPQLLGGRRVPSHVRAADA
jgi:hypothetical protein